MQVVKMLITPHTINTKSVMTSIQAEMLNELGCFVILFTCNTCTNNAYPEVKVFEKDDDYLTSQ